MPRYAYRVPAFETNPLLDAGVCIYINIEKRKLNFKSKRSSKLTVHFGRVDCSFFAFIFTFSK